MKAKPIIFFLCLVVNFINAQIIWPGGLDPSNIHNFDGSYDKFGQGHLFYPNEGEVRVLTSEGVSGTDAKDYVGFYTMYTAQKVYLLNNNNVSFNFKKNDASAIAASLPDTVQRMDVEWQRSQPGAFLARVDTQKFGRLWYYDQYFAASGGRMVEGGAAIACQQIYNNIDLVYTSNNAGIVMYFIVYPGGNYKDIFLHFNGSNSSAIVGNKLIAQGSWDQLTFQKPEMYQYAVSGSVVTPITVCPANWINSGTDTYQINTSTSYNTALPLIIQIKQNAAVTIDTPGLCWSTYFGGWQFEFMTKTRTDVNNNLYVGGMSSSANGSFPQAPGLNPLAGLPYDGALTKFNSVGQIQWSTFIGGSDNEYIRDFGFYGNSIYCIGRTNSSGGLASTSFPTVNKVGAFYDGTWGGGSAPWDGFIYEFEFNPISQPPTFTPKWGTFIGGNGWDDLYACHIDGLGNLYVAGASSSDDMTIQTNAGGYLQNFNNAQLNPSTPVSTDGIIGCFNAAGARQWFTFFGSDVITGSNPYTHAADYLFDITVAGNNVYACGKSGGTNLPGAVNSKFVPGQFDGILANFSTSGALTASKYTDGNIANYAVGERWGEVYTAGEANSAMTAVNSGLWYFNGAAPGGSTDANFSVHTTNLSAATTHNSFLGGSDEDMANDIEFSTNNLLMIAGGTRSSNFPVTSLGSMYSVGFAGGINDNFIAAFQKGDTNILWSTCLGSNYNESQTIPPFINSMFDLANTTISVDNQNTLRMLGSTTSYNTFPLDDGNGIPFFKANSGGLGNDASITCFNMTDVSAIVGVKDFPNTQFAFGLYPNPTSNNLLVTNAELLSDDLWYAVYDANGKKLRTGSLKTRDTKSIDVSALPPGIYIINVSNGKKTFNNKFVKVAD